MLAAFSPGELVFEAVGGHLLFATAIDDDYLLGAQSSCDHCGIDRGVACPDDNYPSTDRDLGGVPQADLLHPVEPIVDAGQFFAWDTQLGHAPQADAEEEGIIVVQQLGQLEVFPNLNAGANLDPERADHLHLFQADGERFT